MMELFDKQLQVGMGQANVRRWVDELMPLVSDDSDPLGTEDLATHRLPLGEGPRGYGSSRRSRMGRSRSSCRRRPVAEHAVAVGGRGAPLPIERSILV
jgi:hypothetical protein